MLNLIFAFLLFMVSFSESLWARDYYVDSIKGKDSNTGTSSRSAWKTLKKVNESAFAPGDNVYLRRGSVWEEELIIPSSGSEDKPITFGAYDSGDRPLIKSSTTFGSWVLFANSDSKKIWKGRITGTMNYWGALKDGVRMPKYYEYEVAGSEWTAPTNLLDMKEGYFFAPLNSGNFYIRHDSGKPPAMEIGTRKYAIYIKNKKHIVISDIDVSGPSGREDPGSLTNFHEIGYFLITVEGSDYITIRNSTGCYHPMGSILVIFGSSNCTLRNVVSYGHGSTGIYFWEAGAGNKVTGTQVYGCGSLNTDFGDMGLIGVWKTRGILIEECYVHDNGHMGAEHMDAGISVVESPQATITRCYIKNAGGTAVQFASNSDNGVLSYSIIDGWGICKPLNHKEGIKIGGGDPYSTDKGCKIYNNLLINGGTTPGEWAALKVLNYENNGLEVKNNIFYNNIGIYEIIAYSSKSRFKDWSFSNNLFYRTEGYAVNWAGKIYDYNHIIDSTRGYYSFDQKQEEGSLLGNPKLLDGLRGLSPDSPCIGNGADVGLSRDYFNNPVPAGRGINIGPFQSEQPLPAPEPPRDLRLR